MRLGGYWPAWIKSTQSGSPSFADRHYISYRTRCCPLCFKEKKYFRSAWGIKLNTICVKHNVILRENCDKCGRFFSFNSGLFEQCLCGKSFDSMSTISIENPNGIASLLSRSLSKKPKKVSSRIPWANLSTQNLIELITGLGSLNVAFGMRKSGVLPGLHKLDIALGVLRFVEDLLQDWPRRYHEFLGERLSAAPGNLSLKRTFGRIYYVIYKSLHHEAFAFLRSEFETFMQRHWEVPLTRRHKNFTDGLQQKNLALPISIVARETQTSKKLLTKLIKDGTVTGKVFKSASGRDFLAVSKEQMPSLNAQLEDLVNLRVASRLLGIGRERVRELIRAGILVPLMGPHVGVTSAWKIRRKDLKALISKMCISSFSSAADNAISVSHILKYFLRGEPEFLSFVRALIEGELQAVRSSQSLSMGKIELQRADFQEWLQQLRATGPEALTIYEAADFMHLKSQVVSELIGIGLLKSYTALQGRRKTWMILRNEIEAFQARYISLAQLAKERKISPRALLKQLLDSKILPITGPIIDGSRQYFYSIKQMPSN